MVLLFLTCWSVFAFGAVLTQTAPGPESPSMRVYGTYQLESFFTGARERCDAIELLLNERAIPYSITGGSLNASICVASDRWDEASLAALDRDIVVMRDSLSEVARLYFSGRMDEAYDRAAASVMLLDRDASASQFYLLMDHSRRRIAMEKDGVRLPRAAEWESLKASLSRPECIERLTPLIPLAPGTIDGPHVVPACLSVVQRNDTDQLRDDASEDAIDPLLELWRMELEPEELEGLFLALSTDWILVPDLSDEAPLPALIPSTREFLCNLINRSLGVENLLSPASLANEEWLDSIKIRQVVEQRLEERHP